MFRCEFGMEEDGEKFGWGQTGKIIYKISLIS